MIVYYILVAIMPFENPPIIWRIVGTTATIKVIGAICIVYALLDIVRNGSIPLYFRTWQTRLFIALLLLATVSFFAKGFGSIFQNTTLLMYLDFLMFFFVTIALVRSVKRLRLTLLAAIAGIAYGSADIIREWFIFHNSRPLYRASDSVGDGNYFSTSAAIFLPFALLMIFNARKPLERLFFAGCLLISLPAIMLTGSRGGTLAVATSLLYVIFHSRHRVRNLALIGLLTLPLAIVLPASPLQRFLHPVNKYNGVNTELFRLEAWAAGLRMFEAYPIFGVGIGNFKILMPRYTAPGIQVDTMAHNTYIEYLAEMGPLGLFLFVAIAYFSLRSLRRVRRLSRNIGPPPTLYLAALSLESGLLGYFVGALFLSAEYEKLLWVAIFLSACLPGLVPSQSRTELQKLNLETPAIPVAASVGEGL